MSRCEWWDSLAQACEDPEFLCSNQATLRVSFDDREPRRCCAGCAPDEDDEHVVHVEVLR